jgi:branched-chain amino acid transport system permease protein
MRSLIVVVGNRRREFDVDFIRTVIVPGLVSGALYALIAVGFAVLFRVTGVLNFAHGTLVMLAPMAVLVLHEKWGIAVAPSYVLAVLVTLAFALVEERVAIRPFLQAGSALPWIVSTLGFSVILSELLSIPFSGNSRSFSYGFSPVTSDILGIKISPAEIAVIIAAPLIAVLLGLVYSRTSLGLKLNAVAQDRAGATAIGIRSDRMSQIAAAAAGLVAAATGLLISSSQLVSSELGITYLFYGFVGASLGGFGSLSGAVIGGFLVGIAAQAASIYIGSLFVNLTLFAGLLAVYLVRPEGLFGRAALRSV